MNVEGQTQQVKVKGERRGQHSNSFDGLHNATVVSDKYTRALDFKEHGLQHLVTASLPPIQS